MAARSSKRQDSECSTAPLADELPERRRAPCGGDRTLVALCSVLMVFCAGLFAGLAVMWVYFGQQIDQLRSAYERLELPGPGDYHVNVTASVNEAVKRYLEREDQKASADHAQIGPPIQTGWSRGSRKPMAHLTGNPRQNIRKHRGEVKLRSWESEQGLATLANGMRYKGGNLIVPADGLYYIYSQLSYRFLNESPDEEHPNEEAKIFQLIHYAYKQSSYPEPQLIMKSSRSTCWSKRTEFGLYTSFQGGVFRLDKGDKVWVSVSNAPMICFEESSSFFGAFMI